jgi:hypothetical protein
MWNVSEFTRKGAHELAQSLGFKDVFALIGAKFVFEGTGAYRGEEGNPCSTAISGTITGIRPASVGPHFRKVWILEVSVEYDAGHINGIVPPGDPDGKWELHVQSNTCRDFSGDVEFEKS